MALAEWPQQRHAAHGDKGVSHGIRHADVSDGSGRSRCRDGRRRLVYVQESVVTVARGPVDSRGEGLTRAQTATAPGTLRPMICRTPSGILPPAITRTSRASVQRRRIASSGA